MDEMLGEAAGGSKSLAGSSIFCVWFDCKRDREREEGKDRRDLGFVVYGENSNRKWNFCSFGLVYDIMIIVTILFLLRWNIKALLFLFLFAFLFLIFKLEISFSSDTF